MLLKIIVNIMIFRDSVEVFYDLTVIHKHRRIEWLTHNVNLRQIVNQQVISQLINAHLVSV